MLGSTSPQHIHGAASTSPGRQSREGGNRQQHGEERIVSHARGGALAASMLASSSASLPVFSQSILPVFPSSEDAMKDMDLGAYDCKIVGDVDVVDDPELGREVLGLMGHNAAIEFRMTSVIRYLAFHVKNENSFLKLKLKVMDSSGVVRQLILTNQRSTVYCYRNVCEMPLLLGPGWQYINLDIAEIVPRAFGTQYTSCRGVQVSGTCKVSKIYFQDREYADAELPSYLCVLPSASGSNNGSSRSLLTAKVD